ncbi:WhiB family transcriptional regulator [Streptomyces racemochromogenes]|uniref:WhiB family transcriptional regulator n=1 Tax=Streptomyces racemochromogenes TaxID=67353 RepID=UPI0031E5BCD5
MIPTTEWMSSAATRPCATNPERWFSKSAKDRNAAVRECRSCPVLQACREYALATRPAHGVWGGLTARALRPGAAPAQPKRSSKVPVDCASPTSYEQHRRRGESCESCLAKRAAQVEQGRRARLAREHAEHGGSMSGYHAHVALGEQPCLLCRAANARRLAERRAAQRARNAA